MQFGLSTDTIQTIFGSKPGIEKAVIYGSRANGNFKEGLDIGIVPFGKNLELSDLFEIETQLSDTPLPYSFDLSVHHFLKNKELLEHTHDVGKLLYKKNKTDLKKRIHEKTIASFYLGNYPPALGTNLRCQRLLQQTGNQHRHA